MWRVSFILMFLSVGTLGWLVAELGLWSSPMAVASPEKKESSGVEGLIGSLRQREKGLSQKESDLKGREQALAGREKVFGEQVGRSGEKDRVVAGQMDR